MFLRVHPWQPPVLRCTGTYLNAHLQHSLMLLFSRWRQCMLGTGDARDITWNSAGWFSERKSENCCLVLKQGRKQQGYPVNGALAWCCITREVKHRQPVWKWKWNHLKVSHEGNQCLCFTVVIRDGERGRHVPAAARRHNPGMSTAAAYYWCTEVELCVMKLWNTRAHFLVVSEQKKKKETDLTPAKKR